MRRPSSVIGRTLNDAMAMATSKERLGAHLRTPLYRNAYYLIVNTGFINACGLAFWLLAAKLYPAKDVGLASATIAAMTLLMYISSLGLDYAIVRFLPKSGEKSDAVVNSCLTLTCLASFIVSLIFVAGLGIWSPALMFLHENALVFCSFVGFTMAWSVFNLLTQAFVAQRRAGFALAQGCVQSGTKVLLVVLLAGLWGSFGITASFGVGTIVAVGVSILFLRRVQPGYRPSLAIKKEIVNDMVHFSAANYVVALLWTAPGFVLPLMVVNMVGAEANAHFYVAWAIGAILAAIALGTSYSLFAEGSHDKGRLIQDTRKSLKLVLFFLAPAIVLVFLAADKILLLFGEAYSESATQLLRVLALGAIPVSVNAIYFGVKRVEMKMKSVIEFSALTAIATLAISWILLPREGIIGAGIAYLVAQSIVALPAGYHLWKRIAHRPAAELLSAADRSGIPTNAPGNVFTGACKSGGVPAIQPPPASGAVESTPRLSHAQNVDDLITRAHDRHYDSEMRSKMVSRNAHDVASSGDASSRAAIYHWSDVASSVTLGDLAAGTSSAARNSSCGSCHAYGVGDMARLCEGDSQDQTRSTSAGRFGVVTVDDERGIPDVNTMIYAVNARALTVTIDSIEQPSPFFTLPGAKTIIFRGRSTDSEWLDTYTTTWDFGDRIVVKVPITGGVSTARHAYSQPGKYVTTLTVRNCVGSSASCTALVTINTIHEAINTIRAYICDLPDKAFQGSPDLRQAVLCIKLSVIDQLVDNGCCRAAILKLKYDIAMMMDGAATVNRRRSRLNSWVADRQAQHDLCLMVDDVIAYLGALL